MIITIDEVMNVHFILADYFKDAGDPIAPAGIKNKQLLESALHRPYTSLGNVEKYPSDDQKGAALLHSMIKNHPFHNGNKRTALVSCLLFYDKLGATINATEDAFYQFIIDIAQGSINGRSEKKSMDKFLQEISKWLRKHKYIYLKDFGDIKTSDFLRNCQNLGANVKQNNGYTVSANNNSIKIAKSTRRFEYKIAKKYLRELGLAERDTGIKFDEFLKGGYTTDNAFKAIIPVLRRLALT